MNGWLHIGSNSFEEAMEPQKRRFRGCCAMSLFERWYDLTLHGLVVAS